MKSLLPLLLPLLLVGCTRGLRIDRTYKATSQDSRAQFLIIHSTECDWEPALKVLSTGRVSSHYLVRDKPVEVYQLVDESRRAYHAGNSSWEGQTMLNAASIGIEIVYRGPEPGTGQAPYPEFPKAQMDVVLPLIKDIVARHKIRPDRILAHSDIAPQRKSDPGPRFPWKRLAEEGLIPWPDAGKVAARLPGYQASLPPVAWFQTRLAKHGFEVPQTGELDPATQRVVAAFQMRFRPERFDGVPDAETAAILDTLTASPEPAKGPENAAKPPQPR